MGREADGLGRGAVIALVVLVAAGTAVVTALVTAAIVDDDPSTDEIAGQVAGELRSELRDFVADRVDEAIPSTTTTSRTTLELEVPESSPWTDLEDLADESVPIELARLTVHSDGCGVIRTEFDETPPNLTWSVKDADGFQVLARSAEGETRYRYFQGGTYTVVLEAWTGDSYAPVSNEVTVTC